jgi:hypothetical protein
MRTATLTPASRPTTEIRWRLTGRAVILVAAGVTAAAVAHAAVTREHLQEVPYLGWCFAVATVGGIVALAALTVAPTAARVLLLVALFHLVMLLVGAWSRTIGLPMELTGEHLTMLEVEPVTGWWLLAMGGELLAVVAGWLALSRLHRLLRPTPAGR